MGAPIHDDASAAARPLRCRYAALALPLRSRCAAVALGKSGARKGHCSILRHFMAILRHFYSNFTARHLSGRGPPSPSPKRRAPTP